MLFLRIEFVDTDAPQDTLAKISSDTIKEGESVTLTCSAKGRPQPSFTWFDTMNNQKSSGAEWNIPSIMDSQSGEYYCEAHNKYGPKKSTPVSINVTCEYFLFHLVCLSFP